MVDDKMLLFHQKGLPHYLEVVSSLKRGHARDWVFLFDRVFFKFDLGFTCPAKTFAIVVHSDDFEYDEQPAVVREIGKAKTL